MNTLPIKIILFCLTGICCAISGVLNNLSLANISLYFMLFFAGFIFSDILIELLEKK